MAMVPTICCRCARAELGAELAPGVAEALASHFATTRGAEPEGALPPAVLIEGLMQPAAGRYTLRGGQEMQLSDLFSATA